MSALTGLSSVKIKEPFSYYQENGFFLSQTPVFSFEETESLKQCINRIIDGQYETPIKPWWISSPETRENLYKINQPHLSSNSLFDHILNPALAAFVAKIVGANKLQLWATQIIHKASNSGVKSSVGWHIDSQYWQFFSGDVFTVWIALDDMLPEMGPLHFASGSHLCRSPIDISAYEEYSSLTKLLSDSTEHHFTEVPTQLKRGCISIHHKDVLHASPGNFSNLPRSALILNLRTENSEIVPNIEDYGYTKYLDNPRICPILFS